MKSKTRRKMTFRRFAYYLLITAIVVSCVTNGIFAKFTTEDAGGDGARVAKFGIKLSVAGDMFSTTYNGLNYKLDEDGYPLVDDNGAYVTTEDSNLPAAWVTTTSDEDVISVQANYRYVLANGTEVENSQEGASFNNVVAPGTKNDTGICIDIQGTAETDCEILFDIEYRPVWIHPGQSYGLMVEIKKEVINEANWEEMVASGLYVCTTEDGYNKYTAVKTTDTYATLYDSTSKFFKMTNYVEALEEYNVNTPFHYPTTLKIKKVSTDTEDSTTIQETDSKDATPSVFFSMFGGLNDIFNIDFPNGNKQYAQVETYPEYISTNEAINTQYYFTWEWEFEDGNDGYDSILGYISAGDEVVKKDGDIWTTNLVEGEDYNLNFEFDAKAIVNQVD